ncbi:MAG: hypothetical protein M3Q73_04255 [bacterium]|nr:hypothetical protein [bacterium]
MAIRRKNDQAEPRKNRKSAVKKKTLVSKGTHSNLKELDLDDEEFDEIELVEARLDYKTF